MKCGKSLFEFNTKELKKQSMNVAPVSNVIRESTVEIHDHFFGF